MSELRDLARRAVDALDEDELRTATPGDVAGNIDPGDIADAVIDLLEGLIAEPLADAQAERACPECGEWTEPSANRTGDPADDRLECPVHGAVK